VGWDLTKYYQFLFIVFSFFFFFFGFFCNGIMTMFSLPVLHDAPNKKLDDYYGYQFSAGRACIHQCA